MDTATEWVDIKTYQTRADVSFKTVNNWIKSGRLPDARKDEKGRWLIPADATPTPSSALATIEPPAVPPTVTGVLATMPGYLELEDAARLLGIPAYAIRSRRDRYRLEPVGERGRLMMPQNVIREVLGA